MKRWLVCLTVCMTLMIGFCVSSQAQDRYLYHFYNAAGDQHFYTADYNEAVRVYDVLHFSYEGVEARVWSDGNDGRVPVYRLYNPQFGDHKYTQSAWVRDNSINNLGYTDEGIAYYLYPYQAPGTFGLYDTFRDYSGPSYFLWWQISAGHSQDEFISMRWSQMVSVTVNDGFGGDYRLAGRRGYAAPGFNGVD